MSPIPFLSKARGTRNLASRIRTILCRFGLSSKKFEYLLNRYITVTRDLDCVPTFAITAVTLKRHRKLVRTLHQQGIEFAVHGYIHTDYGILPLEKQVKHFKKAIDTFEMCQLPFTGFRAPFLRINDKTPQALSNFSFAYDSSQAVHWNVLDKADYTDASWQEYQRLLDFYQSQQNQDCLVLPRLTDGLVEILVSIPDDEAMVERLDIKDHNKISDIWCAILEDTYRNGELFTLQLHPERILLCERSLIDVIRRARDYKPAIWIATLREIAEWWQERSRFTFRINSQGDGRYRVQSECTERATLLIKNCKASVPVDEWFDSYQSIATRDFVIESPTRPVIGISQNSSPAAVSFLRNEGFIVEESDQPDNYGIYLNNLVQFDKAVERSLSQDIERSKVPLLRHWRWPEQARSALSITGDIDSITLKDFILRIMENGLENLRQ